MNSDDYFDDANTQENHFSIDSKISTIHTFINNNRCITRNISSLNPIIIDGDTVMLYANYDKGWDLFSYDLAVPIVLMSSPNGTFDPSLMEDTCSAFSNYINSLLEGLSFRKKNITSSYVDESWKLMSSDIEFNSGDLRPNNFHWFDTIMVDHLTHAHWSTTPPWNSYTPKINRIRSAVGCCAVALGNFIYYCDSLQQLHIPIVPREAEYENDSTVIFSHFVSDYWDHLAYDNSATIDETKQTAKYLGYLAVQIGTKFGITESTSSIQKCKTFIDNIQVNGNYAFNSCLTTYNQDTVIHRLNNRQIVMAAAYKTGVRTTGHTFVIDGLVKIVDLRPSTSDGIPSQPRYYYLMRWGQDDTEFDNVWCNANIDSIWKCGPVNYQVNKKILYQKDLL